MRTTPLSLAYNLKSMFALINTVLLVLSCFLLLLLFLKKTDSGLIQVKIHDLEKSLTKIEASLREDFRTNREENDKIARENRIELKASLDQTSKTQTDKLEALILKIEEKNKESKEAIEKAFKQFHENFDKNVESLNNLQREKFSQLADKQKELADSTEKRLDQMRETVEEKLQKTLNDRLTQSFAMVGTQLESVQKGLGEMQTIASDVGGLKKVLSNVKLRGNVGEVQLAMLLEQILAPTQYEANVRTKLGSADPVEFAVKLPGRSEDESSVVYLPIDAKFPKEIYEHLLAAYDSSIPEEIETASKNMESSIKKMAKDIRDKYIDPPNTTDFAILFLPFESIYAEVIRRSALVDQLRDEFKITVAGPTTLVAILNSLQMGFRTLALQKRSSEVWKVLSSVKKEFDNFGGLLEKAQKNIQAGLGQLDDIAGKRTRAIQRQLRNVETIPAVEAKVILPEITLDLEGEELGDE
jgi:DNA recombination protein RmuC